MDTATADLDSNGLREVLVLEEQGEVLLDIGLLVRRERKINLGFRVAVNLGRALEVDLREELFQHFFLGSQQCKRSELRLKVIDRLVLL